MQNTLPVTNENGYFEIRLESIGGMGANLCGKMLGELGALYLSLNASSFSSYGSEKRGSPVKAFVRWCREDMPIRVNSPVVSPHILCIFHEGLMGRLPVLDGVKPDTKIILNTPLSPDEAMQKYGFAKGTLYCIDALKIAMESHSRINMVLLGAIAKASEFVPLDCVKSLCRDTIGKKYPDLIASNLEGVQKGHDLLSRAVISAASAQGTPALHKDRFTWGWDNAPQGGINHRFGSTVSNDLSPSREGYIPLFCPTGALVKALEKDYPDKPWFVPNKDLLPDSIRYEKTGPNGWITSDSYLDEKRVDGGIT